jgi:hypothetical protein
MSGHSLMLERLAEPIRDHHTAPIHTPLPRPPDANSPVRRDIFSCISRLGQCARAGGSPCRGGWIGDGVQAHQTAACRGGEA